jgi:nucleoid-associated protein YgaU
VQPGDDLWSIAQQVLGQTLGREATQAETTSYWAPLLAANAPTLADPNVLYAGQLVMLPATSELNPKPTAPPPAGSPPAAPDSGAVQRPDPAASAPRISDTAQLPDAAQSGTWTVQPGDDLWSIARQVPGQTLGRVPTQAETTSYWAALIAANSAALSDPNLLYAGQVLTLASSAPPNPRPNPPITPGSPPVTGGSSAVQQPEPAAPAPRISDTPHLPDATRSGTWTVRDGDDLWSITQEVLTQTLGRAPSEADTTSYWRALIAANSPALTDPNVLFAGQLLTLPPSAQPSQQPAQNPQGPAG